MIWQAICDDPLAVLAIVISLYVLWRIRQRERAAAAGEDA